MLSRIYDEKSIRRHECVEVLSAVVKELRTEDELIQSGREGVQECFWQREQGKHMVKELDVA